MALKVDITKKTGAFTLHAAFEAEEGTMGLLGASGTGKSMMLRCIAGIDRPDRGRIELNGRVLYDSGKGICLPARERRVGYLFQNFALFPHMTVAENIRFGMGKMEKHAAQARVDILLNQVRLPDMGGRYPAQLSGGQQQRVALARAMAGAPEALLLDEPFSALDEHLRNQLVIQLMETLPDYRGIGVFVTHNMEEAWRLCQQLVILRDGRVEASGDKRDLFRQPPTRAAARLTGCKNIAEAIPAGEQSIHIPDFHSTFEVAAPVPEGISYAGVRAHDLRLARPGECRNVIPCWLVRTGETPFRMTLWLSPGRPPAGEHHATLQWEITREQWPVLAELPQPWRIRVEPERLMLFEA